MAGRLIIFLVLEKMTRLLVPFTLYGMVHAKSSAEQPVAAPKSPFDIVSTIQNLILDPMETWKQQSLSKLETRPFVTLSFAQSLDAKIALCLDNNNHDDTDHNHPQCTTSANYPLSGPESMLVTHALRSIHDGILVGGRTLLTDNPRLTNRLWNVSKAQASQPRPIVLDTQLRHIRQCWKNGSVLKAKNLIVCCSHEAAELWYSSTYQGGLSRLEKLKNEANMTILPCDTCPNGRLDLKGLLLQLKTKFGIQSLMVEGGSNILSSFVQQEELVDCLCLTIAPKILGSQGLEAFAASHQFKGGSSGHYQNIGLLEFRDIMWVPMGDDCFLLARRDEQ